MKTMPYACVTLAWFVLLTTAACNRTEGQAIPKLPGLTRDTYMALCGIWVTHRGAQTEEGQFSWGKAMHVPMGSINIDLGADPPYLSLPGGLFHIRSVTAMGPEQLQLEMVWKRSNVEDVTVRLEVHFNADGTMWWVPNGIMGQGKDVTFYRIDGPKAAR